MKVLLFKVFQEHDCPTPNTSTDTAKCMFLSADFRKHDFRLHCIKFFFLLVTFVNVVKIGEQFNVVNHANGQIKPRIVNVHAYFLGCK